LVPAAEQLDLFQGVSMEPDIADEEAEQAGGAAMPGPVPTTEAAMAAITPARVAFTTASMPGVVTNACVPRICSRHGLAPNVVICLAGGFG
jgi:hypothetical protein